jgi:hypothetical protein
MLQNPEWFNIDPDAAEAAAAEVEQIAEASETPIDAAAAAEGAAAEACVPTEETPCPEPAAEALSN